MMKHFRGRNLAHPGCLIGVTTGLIVGIILAGVLASAFNVGLNAVLLFWLGLTVGLGAIGWVMGSALSSRFAPLEEEGTAGSTASETTSFAEEQSVSAVPTDSGQTIQKD